MNKTFLPATVAMLSFSVASSALAAGAYMPRPPHAMNAAESIQSRPKPMIPGLPAYLMRSDGLMTNGKPPNRGWQD